MAAESGLLLLRHFVNPASLMKLLWNRHLLGYGAPCGCVRHGWVLMNLILRRGDGRKCLTENVVTLVKRYQATVCEGFRMRGEGLVEDTYI